MTCALDHTMRRSAILLGLVVFAVLPIARVEALQPPTAAEWQELVNHPDELQLRIQKARSYGDHKVKPWLVESTARRLSALTQGGHPKELPPPAWRGMPTTGTNNILVFMIDFPEYGHVNTYEDVTNSLFGDGLPINYPTESLTRFYERSSYGLLKIQGQSLGWYRMKHSRDWYTTTYGTGNEANYAIIKEVAEFFDSSIDYAQFDNNGDGTIDYFAVLWAGPDNGWANFWWGKQWNLLQDLTLDGVKFDSFSWQWESNPKYPPYRADFSPGVIIHETGHALGLPDYYDYEDAVGPRGGVGGMDMMAANVGDHNCFSKFMLEWLTPTIITNAVNDLPLRAAANFPDAVALAKGYTGPDAFAEYFMVQNRQRVNNDQNLPGAGLVIWHVDARLDGAGYDFLYDNSYTQHKLLRLMEADGLEQIEAGGQANAGDFYIPGRVLTPQSMPSSLSYAGLSTEVRVTDISPSAPVVTADYSALDNFAIFDETPVYVLEGTTTNVNISLWVAPVTDVTVTVSWLAGSTNLYLAGASNFTFTALDYATPQALLLGSLNDADATNDTAIFRIGNPASGIQNVDVSVRQMDLQDTLPPGCIITAAANAERSEVTFDLLFDEDIKGFDSSDVVTADNIAGGVSVLSGITNVAGSNRLYRVVFAVADTKGAITLTVPPDSLTDLSGNRNPNPEYRCVYTLPWVQIDFADNFDGASSVWVRSTNAYAKFTMDGWRWGAPLFNEASWMGPVAAYSGDKCWGTMMGPYGQDLTAWVKSPSILVGAHPVLSFQLNLNLGQGSVEAYDGTSWHNVTPGSYLSDTTGWDWIGQSIVLDNERFGNRMIQIRFRSFNAAMYIDDVRIESQQGPAVWMVSGSPTNGPAGTSIPVVFQVYNSTTTTLAGVAGQVSCADAGVTISGGTVAYGTLLPGALATAGTAANVNLSAAPVFGSPLVHLWHQSKVGTTVSSSGGIAFGVDGVAVVPATNVLILTVSDGVVDWLGRRLAGDGSGASCIFQVLYAGPDGVANPPTAMGQATADDRILYSSDAYQPWGRFGEGAVAPNLGRFVKSFAHGLASNSLIYVRAWDAAAIPNAVAYGDSSFYALNSTAVQSHDFGTWRVDRPIDALRDSNGDSIPDGYSVLHQLDPRDPIRALHSEVMTNGAFGTGAPGSGLGQLNLPVRVAVSSNRVYIADTGNNRILVRDRALTNHFFAYTGFLRPRGIAINAAGTHVAVADTERSLVKVYTVVPGTGELVAYTNFGGFGSAVGKLNKPYAVAFAPSGRIYVADSHVTDGDCNHRLQAFNPDGSAPETVGGSGTEGGRFHRPLGIDVDHDGSIYVADGANHRVQTLSFTHGFLGQIGITSVASNTVGLFDWPADVHIGVGNRLYVADRNNHRLQVFDVDPAQPASVLGAFGVAGDLPGQFNYPQGVTPALDGREVYVADTQNHRIQRVTFVMDRDGDGMDDVWEDLNGLDSRDPADGSGDLDGDGLLNIGEFRLGTDPQAFDSNGNGAGDGWDIIHGQDPLVSGGAAVTPPRVTLTASPSGTVLAGEVVRLTATFTEAIAPAPAPRLTLSGGATLLPTAMTASNATVFVYEYTVGGGDNGAVDGAVSGAFDLDGLSLDPDPTAAHALFTVETPTLSITNITAGAMIGVAWNAISGKTYRVQGSPDLIVTNWVDDDTVMATSNGVWNWTDAMPTNRVRFYRVIWDP